MMDGKKKFSFIQEHCVPYALLDVLQSTKFVSHNTST